MPWIFPSQRFHGEIYQITRGRLYLMGQRAGFDEELPPPPWRPELPDFTKGETWHEVLTVEKIEARERVDDEPNGMIGVPFGYLNPVWLAFKAKLKERDEICVYRYTPFPGQPWYAWWSHGAEGYALRRGGEVIEKIIARAD